ncbi:uncharacterized protein Z519_06299 [Cladophialophora bantiana CBS 173.52]|uniref:CipC-like antibiotic response protein n=1 Tax=Cladophialophora bantiana (strain ATCC 10958 / CBS 173.52 / CDC B-1940 / NIH 8579) TaxID=1442370 RepID=A0A0D2G141_CLAB1|nr:uncharacterized protein Z519_06299 [Cladophialophora bantiana CBS 173.52]KIW92452.1 hypothetical protein Z519_06299 [Cladophialophora bantiana CBS 173.52]
MFGWDESRDAHQQVYQGDEDHQAKFSHELIGGAAAFEGMKLYEDRQRREGKTVNHGFAKELLAGFVGAEVDKLAETKGLDEYDKIRAREHAKRSAENMYDQHYGDMDQYDPNQRDQPNFNY